MTGETSDISQFCEFAFYDWIMFCDQPVAFPDDNPVLGRYLGPAIDVGPALTAKILKVRAALIKNYSSYVQNKKKFQVFFPKTGARGPETTPRQVADASPLFSPPRQFCPDFVE